VVRLCVCVSVCLSVGRDEPCKTGSTDQDAAWGMTHVGQRNHQVLNAVQIPQGEWKILGLSGPFKGIRSRFLSRLASIHDGF